ncbi:hypothetical protein CHUAL_004367 [Chamberlinius hualienensis]
MFSDDMGSPNLMQYTHLMYRFNPYLLNNANLQNTNLPSTVSSETPSSGQKKRKISVDNELRDEVYWKARSKNHVSANKSRDRKRAQEEANRVAFVNEYKKYLENMEKIAELEKKRQVLQRKCLALGIDYS